MSEKTDGGDDGLLGKNSEVIPELIADWNTVPTFPIDGVGGMFVSRHQTKLTIVEHHPTEDGLKARPVANLVFPNDQFLKIADGIAALAAKIREMQKADQDGG